MSIWAMTAMYLLRVKPTSSARASILARSSLVMETEIVVLSGERELSPPDYVHGNPEV
jgi:hypothetical protein